MIAADTKTVEERQAVLASTLRTLMPPGSLFELRFLGRTGAHSGFFDDYEAAAAFALAFEAEGFACYFALNPIKHSVRTVVWHNDAGCPTATNDSQVLHRQWLLIDVDPVRPAGVASREAEKEQARQLMAVVCKYLRGKGWGLPLLADSGNGYHALYNIALPSCDKGLVRRVLQSVAQRFDNDAAKVDTTVYNASRICRLYGTLNRKGDHTEERPHRYAKLRPGQRREQPVPAELLEAVATDNPTAQRSNPPKGKPSKYDLATVRERMHKRSAPPSGCSVIERARAYVAKLPPAIEGENGSAACFRAACALVKGFDLSPDEAYPLLQEYSLRCVPPWSEKELWHKLEDAAKKAEEEPDQTGKLLRDKPAKSRKTESGKEKRKSTKDDLLSLVESRCELWHTPDEHVPFASVSVPDREIGLGDEDATSDEQVWHTENVAVESKRFAHLLASAYLGCYGVPATKTALEEATFATAALARCQGATHQVHARVAPFDHAVCLDLANKAWEAVVVEAERWGVVGEAPAKFRRPRGMMTLPTPERGGSVELFRQFVNVGSDTDLLLLLAWLVMALRPKGPYPLLCVHGEQGSAKSTTARVLRELVDPYRAALRRMPTTDRDLMIAANNSWVLGFDNLSRLEPELSDALCVLSTGGGYSTRELYTDKEEAIFDVTRPVILTGINEIATKPDLLDRSLVVRLPVIGDQSRKTEDEFWADFRAAQPRLLGLLLDGVATALANRDAEAPGRLQRMADFACWAAAAMPAFGYTADEFRDAYEFNIADANNTALEDSPIVPVLRKLLRTQGGKWPRGDEPRGAETLLRNLTSALGADTAKTMPGWPKRANNLSFALRRLAPVLRRSGVEVEFMPRQTSGERITPIEIRDTNSEKRAGKPE